MKKVIQIILESSEESDIDRAIRELTAEWYRNCTITDVFEIARKESTNGSI